MQYIIYHEVKPGIPCADGLAAAWVAKQQYPDAALIGCVYGQEVAFSHEPEFICIVDFSFPKSVLEDLGKKCPVQVIDHHITAMNDLQGLSDRITAKFDMNECGATLAWKTFFPDELMPEFLRYVKDRDLWDFLLPHSAEVHEAMAYLKKGLSNTKEIFTLFDGLAKLTEDELLAFLYPVGHPLIAPKQQKIAEVASRFHLWYLPQLDGKDVYDKPIPVVELAKDGSEDRLTSEVCMKLYRDMPQYDFVACITSDGTWSLRSDKHGSNFDVSAVAKAYSGGGHRNASGFKPPEQ